MYCWVTRAKKAGMNLGQVQRELFLHLLSPVCQEDLSEVHSFAHSSSAQTLEYESGGVPKVQPRTRRSGPTVEGGKQDWTKNSNILENRF